ncbi:hypothetical protein Dimus_039029 [Dionaea muscipula]
MGRVVPLVNSQLTGSKSNNFPVLHEDTTQTLQRSITIHDIPILSRRQRKNRCRGQSPLELNKTTLTVIGPIKSHRLPSEAREWQCNRRKSLNETSLVTRDVNESNRMRMRGPPYPYPYPSSIG